MMKDEIVVLAYSGGLDTSYCIKYLSEELGMRVHAICVNTGGFDPPQIEEIVKKAYDLGAEYSQCLEAAQTFYDQCLRYLIYGNVLRNSTYPLSVSSERMLQAVEIARYVKKVGARYIAHGSTGAGNDQIRFDLVFETLIPEAEIITPIRDGDLSRDEEIRYLTEKGVQRDWTKARYSINKGLWGTSVGGAETLTSDQALPEDAWPTPCTKTGTEEISLRFAKGDPVAINGEEFGPVELIKHLTDRASTYGIGRDIHVGDTIIGIKGRVGFEASAPLIIIRAHQLLEKHVLSKWQIYWKEQLSNWYGMMVHEGEFLDPLLRNIEVFFEDTQRSVSGEVFIKLHPYRFELQGIKSDFDLMNSAFGQYGEKTTGWSGEDARGFTKILSNRYKITQQIHQDQLSNL